MLRSCDPESNQVHNKRKKEEQNKRECEQRKPILFLQGRAAGLAGRADTAYGRIFDW